MIPLHKYSYPYLGQLEFISVAFILLVGVTRLWVKVIWGKFNWMGMIWKEMHVLIKGQSADNAYQSKNQALGSKEQSVELRNRFVSNHTSGEEFIKKFCFIEGSQKHVVSCRARWLRNSTSLGSFGYFHVPSHKCSNNYGNVAPLCLDIKPLPPPHPAPSARFSSENKGTQST